MITFHDPRGEVGTPVDAYTLAHDLTADAGRGTTVALLANGFPDSENFLSALGKAIKNRLPGIEVRAWNKGNASIPAPAEMLEEIRAHCQVAIAAYGH